MKLLLIMISISYLAACEKLDDQNNSNVGDLAHHNQKEIEELNRSVNAEKLNSRDLSQNLEGDVRALQDWRNMVHETAISSEAFNIAVEKQFQPLYDCLNNLDNSSCLVIQEIKSCLSSPNPQNSDFCAAIDALFAKNLNQDQKIDFLETCLRKNPQFQFSLAAPWTIDFDETIAGCTGLQFIAEYSRQLAEALDKKIDDSVEALDKKIDDRHQQQEQHIKNLEQRIAELESTIEGFADIATLLDRLSNLEGQRTHEIQVIEKLSADSKQLFLELKREGNMVNIDDKQINDCMFNNLPSNSELPNCLD